VSQQTTNRYFDELASGLASGSISRGKALRLMGAALVGGMLASLGIGEASADLCKPNGKACKKNSQCCSGNCANGTCAQFIGCDPQGGICDSLTFCNNNRNCLCLQTAEGSGICWNAAASQPCDAYQICTTSLDCPTGQLCTVNGCCGNVCIPPDQMCPPQGVALS
jgi:hypothetical protein